MADTNVHNFLSVISLVTVIKSPTWLNVTDLLWDASVMTSLISTVIHFIYTWQPTGLVYETSSLILGLKFLQEKLLTIKFF